MEKQLIANLYNPAQFTSHELIDRFVVRMEVFQRIYRDLATSLMKRPEQQYLILGRRGMGKTTLLLRLAYEMEQDTGIQDWMLPVVFHEEEYAIDSLELFWERVAAYLEDHHPLLFSGLERSMSGLYSGLKDHPELFEEKAFNLLLNALRDQGKKLVLFIDNFGEIYQRFQTWEIQRLRTVLQTVPDLRIVGTTSIILDELYDAKHPFYEFFKVVKLDGLKAEETKTLLLALAAQQQDESVKKIVHEQPERIEVMRRLTGGVIRTIILLYEVFAESHEGRALRDLTIIADRTTPLYQDKMKELSDQQKKIVHAIALAWDGVTAAELSDTTRLSSKHISSQLKILVNNGTLERRQIPGNRQHIYLIQERFFNIWFLMRFGRSDRRVTSLTPFLGEWGSATIQKPELSTRLAGEPFVGYPNDAMESHTLASIYLWKNSIQDALELSKFFLFDTNFLNEYHRFASDFLLLCLAKEQFDFVREVFVGEAGKALQLKDRFKPVWYTLAYLQRDRDPLEFVRMGAELEETVKEMVAKVAQYKAQYA